MMKRLTQRLFTAVITLAIVLSLAPIAHAATYDYAVEGGNLKFDPTTGTITGCDKSVYSANIPSEIYGVKVTTIGKNAFRSCSKLSSVVIPSTVTKIEDGAFINCPQLVFVLIPDSVTVIEDSPGNYVQSGIFYNCDKLESITIPGSIKRLPDYIFNGCDNLKTVTLESGIEKIGEHAFSGCKSLENITIPDSVSSIEKYAFYGCVNLTTVTIGNGVKHIDDNAFYNTTNLKSLNFRGNAPSATSKIINKFADGFMIYYPAGASGWTTPTWNGFITQSYTLPGTTPEPAPTPTPEPTPTPTPATTKVTAIPTNATVLVNGQTVAFDAYSISGNNYFKLRDLALVLTGTKAQFNVVWDESLRSIALLSGQAYVPVGGEMSGKGSVNQVGTLNTSKIYLNGMAVSPTAYTIQGNNYFKLRDIGALFNFGVEWDNATRTISIDTSKPYVDE